MLFIRTFPDVSFDGLRQGGDVANMRAGRRRRLFNIAHRVRNCTRGDGVGRMERKATLAIPESFL